MSTQLQYQGISENMKYVFTNKGIVPTVDFFKNDKKINIIEYSYENLNIAVDILKEHKEIYYKLDSFHIKFTILSASIGKLPVYSNFYHQGTNKLSFINLNQGVLDSPFYSRSYKN